MTAKQALRISRKAARKDMVEWRKQQAALKERNRLMEKARKENVAPFIEECLREVKMACDKGYVETKVLLPFSKGTFTVEVAKLAQPRLIKMGYEVLVSSESVFTGVDEWREDHFIRLNWGGKPCGRTPKK